MSRSSVLKIAAAVLTSAFAAGGPAYAYIPPSQLILKNVLAKHNGFKGFRVRSVVRAMEGEKPGAQIKALTVYEAKDKVLRSWAYDENNQELYAAEKKGEKLSLPSALLFESQLRAVADELKRAGIAVRTDDELLQLPNEDARREAEVLSLARLKSQIAWVIGPAKADKKKNSPQLWVEKDTFLPMRLLFRSAGGEATDARFENYRFQKEFPFPRLLSLARESGEVFLKEEVSEVTVNPELTELKTPLSPGFTDAGNSASSSVRDLIRQYYDALR